jgi:HK97 family phage major capsid protein
MKLQNVQMREARFDGVARDESGRFPVVISSDAVVDVGDIPEILDHSPQAVDLSRAPLPIIVTHRGGQINVGIVEDLAPSGGKMRGFARFGERPEAVGYAADVASGVIRSVSVGYARVKSTLRRDGVLVTSRWLPTHVALVAEPADINAGFFREMSAPPEFELDVERDQEVTPVSPPAAPAILPKGRSMEQQQNAPAGDTAGQTRALPNGADSVKLEELRVEGIRAIARQHKIGDDVVRQWVEHGYSVDDAARCTLDVLVARQGQTQKINPADLGMTRKEAEAYSMLKAVRAVLNKDWSKAGLELEAHRAIQQRLGGNPLNEQTFFVPVEAQTVRRHRETRDMTSAGSSGSNYLVATENVSFIDLLRNRSVCMRMGAGRLTGLVGNVTVPRQTASATTYWLTNEATAITESQPTIGQLSLTPKHVGAYTEISRLLALQSSPDAESLVMNDLAKAIGLAADLAGLAGTGSSGQPTGIAGTSGVGSVTGTSIAYSGMLEFQTDIGNALSETCGYVTTAAVAALLMQRVKFSGTASPLWDGSILDANVCGFRGMSSAQATAASIIFGAWDQLVMAEWGSLAIEVNPFANFQAGLVGVRALYAMDIGVRVPSAFSIATSVT